MKTTVAIQIGNSDDKLTQIMWAMFIDRVDILVHHYAADVHFSGFSNPVAVWQNACWVLSVTSLNLRELKEELSSLCKEFNQDSIAWTEGITEFLGS